MKPFYKSLLLMFSFAALVFVMSCSENESPQPDGTSEIAMSTAGNFGTILVDGNGVSLYFFANDADGQSACMDGCLNSWPIFYAEDPTFAEGLDPANFSVITHSNGEQQTTYKGWPLYYYAPAADGQPEEAGATGGDGVGQVWFIAKPDYDVMIVNHQLTGHDGVNYTSDYTEGSGTTTYMVDAEGNTLYGFINDYKGVNNFTAEDFSNDAVWPIFGDFEGNLPSVLNPDDFQTINVYGRTQVTYKGWPLYFFGQDEDRGDNKGVSFPAPGVWPVLNMDSPEAPEEPTVKLMEDENFGEVMTDGDGQVLYFFTKDVSGESMCVDGCLNFWPVFHASEIIVSQDGSLAASDFSTITRSDGSMQTTYKGWPLYYFSSTGDGVNETAGEINGDGANDVWYVAKENYDLMIADAQLVGHDGKNYMSDYTEGEGITNFFTDQEGRTLYIFINDELNTNNFTNEDFSNNGVWPIFHTDIDELPSGMNAADFGEIEVFGEMQLTYKGWPVYYFGQDENRGETKGVSFPAPGVWPIINNGTSPAQ